MIDILSEYIDFILALAALLGVVKSSWNGILRQLYVATRELPEIHEEVKKISPLKERVEELHEQHEEFEEKQGEMKDAVIALARSQNDESIKTNPEQFQRKLSDNHSAEFTRQVNAEESDDD